MNRFARWLDRAAWFVLGGILAFLMLATGVAYNLREAVGVDWSQFIPDAVLTIPTAALIGLGLWQVQRLLERSRTAEHSQDEWELARIEFIPAFQAQITERVRSINSYVEQFEPAVKRAAKTQDFAAWYRAAGHKVPEIRRLRGLLLVMPQLRAEGAAVEAVLRRRARVHEKDDDRRRQVVSAAMWLLFGNSAEDSSLGGLIVRRNQEAAAALVNDPEVQEAWQKFSTWRVRAYNYYMYMHHALAEVRV